MSMNIVSGYVTPQLLSVIWKKLEGQIGNLLTRYFWGKLVIKLFNLSHPPTKQAQTHSSSHLLHHFFPLASRNLLIREDYVSIDSPRWAKTPWDFEVQETQGKNLSFLKFLLWNPLDFVSLWCLWYILDGFGEYWKFRGLWGFGQQEFLLNQKISNYLGVFALMGCFGCLFYQWVLKVWFPRAAIWVLLLHELIPKVFHLHLNGFDICECGHVLVSFSIVSPSLLFVCLSTPIPIPIKPNLSQKKPFWFQAFNLKVWETDERIYNKSIIRFFFLNL